MEDGYLQKLQPFLEKNNGNLSAAIRDVIELADAAMDGHTSVEEAMEHLTEGSGPSSHRNHLVESKECVLISQLALRWLIGNADGILVEDEIVSELFNPYQIKTLSDLVEYLNTRSQKLGWGLEVSANCNGAENPEKIVLLNGDPSFRDFISEIITIFLARHLKMDISFVHRKSNSIQIYLQESGIEGPELPPGIKKNFGHLDAAFKEIRSQPDFWNLLIERYRKHRYDRVNLNRKVFEGFLVGDVPDISKYFEASAGRPIREIPFSELVTISKEFVSVTQFVSAVETEVDGVPGTLKIRHRYTSEKATPILVEFFSNVIRAAGYVFEVRTVANLIIFEITDRVNGAGLPSNPELFE